MINSSKRYNVYVIELEKSVLEKPKFRERNPNYIKGKSCVYGGMTSKPPDKRFKDHKSGYKSSKYPKKFGLYLRRKLYEKYNPMTYEEAKHMEEELALKLQQKGYAVWWN